MTCPTFSVSPSDPTFFQDPYPTYDRLRQLGPLVYWSDYGFPVTGHYDVVSDLLRDRRFGREVTHVVAPETLGWQPPEDHVKLFYDFEKSSMLEREPPAHTRLRGLVNRAFVSRAIEKLRPRIATLCHDLVDGFAANGCVDILDRFATPIPVVVIAELLGLPVSDAPLLLEWSHSMVAMYQFNRSRAVEDAAVAATRAFSDYVRERIADRRARPADDLLTALISARDHGERLSEDELISTVILLMNAGHEATVHAIGNGIKALLDLKAANPKKSKDLSDLMQTGEGAAALAEEIVRYDPPLHLFTRFALEPLELFGQTFAVGDRIGLLLAAANRDPGAYPAPHLFDPSRYIGPNPARVPMSFGAGIHFCVGAPLARLEIQIALPILFRRLPTLCLAGTPSYRDNFHFHGLSHLAVKWGS